MRHLLILQQVPKVQDFSEEAQLHGQFIVEIKKRWPCQTHSSEHGQAGHCYIPPHGEHVRLNPYRFKLWAAAIVRHLSFYNQIKLIGRSEYRLLAMQQSTSHQIFQRSTVPVMVE